LRLQSDLLSAEFAVDGVDLLDAGAGKLLDQLRREQPLLRPIRA
jgi:hypothetical protein